MISPPPTSPGTLSAAPVPVASSPVAGAPSRLPVRRRDCQGAALPVIFTMAAAAMLFLTEQSAYADREPWQDFKAEPHSYWTRPVKDRFSLLKDDLASGKIPLDRTSAKAFVASLLHALEVPSSSQIMVFSTTSLQLNLISPRNPRAIYFNDDTYVGWMPGGKVEIISLDPGLGGIFYILDVPAPGSTGPLQAERSQRCMNCHGAADSGWVPGLAVSSVIPGHSGGSLISYRQEILGHFIPLSERMGGWFVTGTGAWDQHRGNATGDYENGRIVTRPLQFGTTFDPARYPGQSSDLLAHLLHEHQAGFISIALEAGYRARSVLHENHGTLPPAREPELHAAAEKLVRYLLFADEAALPPRGLTGLPQFRQDFAATRRPDSAGNSLRDLDLTTRLLRHRCSYMIYSPVFTGLDPAVKRPVLQLLGQALAPGPGRGHELSRHLPAAEKAAIRSILDATLPGWNSSSS